MSVKPRIEITADGSQTLVHPLCGEAYHSRSGAVAESQHVFVAAGFDRCPKAEVSVLEIGFGSGLNALLTLHRAAQTGRKAAYTAVELYPVDRSVVAEMELGADPGFLALHDAEWGVWAAITENFALRKIECDLTDVAFETIFDTLFDVIYFDAFAPDTQPEMWSVEIFRKIFARLSPGGLLVTYSAKGEVKRALREAGFEVRRLPGAPGKRHMTLAVRP